MADNEPGGDTAMFRAFVEGADGYREHKASKGPLVVALVAVLIAAALFALIVARR